MTLSVLVALHGKSKFLEGFDIHCIVKESGIDDEGLFEFYHDYCFGKFQIYVDKSWAFYKALGERKSFEFPSLWNILQSFIGDNVWKRITSKGIQWNTKGEGLVKGGIIIFDAEGKPKYVLPEQMGQDLNIHDMILAMEAIRQEEKK